MTLHSILNIILAALPLVLLILLMTLPRGLASHQALPLMALFAAILGLIWFLRPPLEVAAAAITGLGTALTPLAIMAGALLVFKSMELSGALESLSTWLKSISTNKVALAMLVGWAFSFLLEGAGGFGTPIALAAPLLVGLGFDPFRTAVFTLVMNTVPVTFGAVGTPVWFGFSRIPNLVPSEILEIGTRSALLHGIASLVIPLAALCFLIPWREVKKNILFVYVSVAVTVIPYLLLSFVSVEFPALGGGLIGTILTALAARAGWGLEPSELLAPKGPKGSELIRASFPLWASTGFLVVSRIPGMFFHDWIYRGSADLSLKLGGLGNLGINSSLAISLSNILGTSSGFVHKTLYVPSILPFVAAAAIGLMLYRSPKAIYFSSLTLTLKKLGKAALALAGALILVEILSLGGNTSAISIMGAALASSLGSVWYFGASYLGALGAFFSGSNTVANLTFGGIQNDIALRLGLDKITVLALQATGGAYGHMVAIGPVISACTMLGLKNKEGALLRAAFPYLLVYGLIVGLVAVFLWPS